MRKQVETWQRSELTDVTAKVVIYEAFVEGRLEVPKHLARSVHHLYFEPKIESGVRGGNERATILEKLTALEQTQGSSSYAQRYSEFIAAAANHMTLIAPFIPALTELLHKVL